MRRDRIGWSGIVALGFACAASACAPAGSEDVARVRLSFGGGGGGGGGNEGSGPDARARKASSSTALDACAPSMHIELREGEVGPIADNPVPIDALLFNWESYFSSTTLQTTDDAEALFSEGTAEIELEAGKSWKFTPFGAVALKASGTPNLNHEANLSQLSCSVGPAGCGSKGGIFSSATQDANNYVAGQWQCGSLGDWTNVDATLEELASAGPILGPVPQFVVPITGNSVRSEELRAGSVADVPLEVTVARVPFGAYALVSLKDAGFTDEGLFLSSPAIRPFVVLKLTDISSRIQTSLGSSVRVVPLLKDVESGQLWRGAAETNLMSYGYDGTGTEAIYLYPVPGDRQYRVGLFLFSVSSSGFSVTIDETSYDTSSRNPGWTLDSGLCLWGDIDLRPESPLALEPDSYNVVTLELDDSEAWSVGWDKLNGALSPGWSSNPAIETDCYAKHFGPGASSGQ